MADFKYKKQNDKAENYTGEIVTDSENANGTIYEKEGIKFVHFGDNDIFDKDAFNYNFQLIEKQFNNPSESFKNIIKDYISNIIYPIGSIYITATEANPSSFLGGTWAQIAQGQCLFGVNTAEGTSAAPIIQPSTTQSEVKAEHQEGAGQATHKLAIAELPSHSHNTVATQQELSILNNSGKTGIALPNHSHSAALGTDDDKAKTSRKRKFMMSATTNTDAITAYGNLGEIYVNEAAYNKNSTYIVPVLTKLDSNNKGFIKGVTKSDKINEYTAGLYTGGIKGSETISGKVRIPTNITTGETGNNEAFSLLPPYLGVYFWQRTA